MPTYCSTTPLPRLATSSVATASVRQVASWAAKDDFAGLGSVTMTVLAGSSLVVFITDMNIEGAPAGAGAPTVVTADDNQSGVYTGHGYVQDTFDLQVLHMFTRKNTAAGSITVNAHWVTTQWHGFTVVEVTGVGTNPTITPKGLFNRGPLLATDAVTTGTVALGSSPAFLVALGQNATDALGSDGYPSAGTGFSTTSTLGSDPTCWNWALNEGTSNNNVGLVESRYLASPGTVAATFSSRTPGPSDENWMAWMAAFQ